MDISVCYSESQLTTVLSHFINSVLPTYKPDQRVLHMGISFIVGLIDAVAESGLRNESG